jgi:hypothetical protein
VSEAFKVPAECHVASFAMFVAMMSAPDANADTVLVGIGGGVVVEVAHGEMD